MEKRLLYIVNDIKPLSDKMAKIDIIKVLFDKKEIPNIIVSDIRFFNMSLSETSSLDFDSMFPLVIKTDGEFLVHDSVNEFLVVPNNSYKDVFLKLNSSQVIQVDLGCLKRFEEFRLLVLHTGCIEVNGSVKHGTIKKIEAKSFVDFFSYITILSMFMVIIVYFAFLNFISMLNLELYIAIGGCLFLALASVVTFWAFKKQKDQYDNF